MSRFQHAKISDRFHGREKASLIGAVLTGVLILACYAFVLRLPFFYDDLPIMTWVSRHDGTELWTLSSENAYYRPLAFTIYKLGQLLPAGVRQIALHAVPLVVHWMNALLILQVVPHYRQDDRGPHQAALAAVFYSVFPFFYLAVPWVTAFSHPLVTLLILAATYGALRAECKGSARWWGISLLATVLAPFAHESGVVAGLIVGGVVLIRYGVDPVRRRWIAIGLGLLLNVGAVFLRNFIPGVGQTQFVGLQDWFQNGMYFLHGLVYPLGPIIGQLVNRYGWSDFLLVVVTSLLLALALGLIVYYNRTRAESCRDGRWMAAGLWWWACGALPALASLRYGALFTSPRLYMLPAVGIVVLWAGLILDVGHLVRQRWTLRFTWGLLAGAIILSNVTFLARQRTLFTSLNRVYQQVLQAAREEENTPLGFVNLPGWLAYRDKVYALTGEGVEFLPTYSSIAEFIEVNLAWRAADGVMFEPVLRETELAFGFRGRGLNWEEMRQFALDRGSVWLTFYQDGEFVLRPVGSIIANTQGTAGTADTSVASEPLVRFEGGPVIQSASAQLMEPDGNVWAVTLTWLASGPIEGDIFVHVRDAQNNVVTQADGPALGGMVPIWLWQSGDRIQDIRYVTLPNGEGPYTVQVGVYNAAGRFPALMKDVRVPDDAAPVATLTP